MIAIIQVAKLFGVLFCIAIGGTLLVCLISWALS